MISEKHLSAVNRLKTKKKTKTNKMISEKPLSAVNRLKKTADLDTCQNKVSADQYHVTISRAQVESLSRLAVFLS